MKALQNCKQATKRHVQSKQISNFPVLYSSSVMLKLFVMVSDMVFCHEVLVGCSVVALCYSVLLMCSVAVF